MKSEDIRVGEVYRIRQWDDMAEEFGMTGNNIACAGVFVQEMRYLCGESVEVLQQRQSYASFTVVSVRYLNRSVDGRSWTITPDMLEPEEELPDVDPASIFYLLEG